MSFFDWLFGDSDPAPVTATTHSTSSVPEYIAQPTQRLLSESERLISQPYQAYQGPRIAELTPDQLAAFDMTRGMVGTGANRAGAAYGISALSSMPVTGQEIRSNMNPFLREVGMATENELRRSDTIGRQSDAYNAARSGAFGGSRQGVVEAERARNFERNLSDTWARIYGQGYNEAVDLSTQNRDIMRQGALGMGTTATQAQNLGMADVNQMLGIGALQQGQTQQNLDLGYQDFQAQQQYPYQQLNFMRSMLSGVPYSTTQTQTSTAPGQTQPGFFQTAAGLGIAGLGALGQLNWRPFD